jgi:AcrR family transcriptional regulator
VSNAQASPATRRPSLSNPRVRRTREGILASARELLAEQGLEALTYSTLAERARVTRQTLYRHWPTRSALLRDLILEVHEQPLGISSSDPAAVARGWLYSIRRGLADQATRSTVAAVVAQADFDPDSAQALSRISQDRLEALNVLMEPCGLQLTADQYSLLCGPVLMRILIDHAEAPDAFLDAAAEQWAAQMQGSD